MTPAEIAARLSQLEKALLLLIDSEWRPFRPMPTDLVETSGYMTCQGWQPMCRLNPLGIVVRAHIAQTGEE